jgi:hypothetical protein
MWILMENWHDIVVVVVVVVANRGWRPPEGIFDRRD